MVIMAHRFLATFAPVALDIAQEQTWEGSVWQRWGKG
jgi:hypothetical protein